MKSNFFKLESCIAMLSLIWLISSVGCATPINGSLQRPIPAINPLGTQTQQDGREPFLRSPFNFSALKKSDSYRKDVVAVQAATDNSIPAEARAGNPLRRNIQIPSTKQSQYAVGNGLSTARVVNGQEGNADIGIVQASHAQEEIFVDQAPEMSGGYAQDSSQMESYGVGGGTTPYPQPVDAGTQQGQVYPPSADGHYQGHYQNQSAVRGSQLQQQPIPASLQALELMDRNKQLEREYDLLHRNNEALQSELSENNQLLEAAKNQIEGYELMIAQQLQQIEIMKAEILRTQQERDGIRRQYEMEIEQISSQLDEILFKQMMGK
ncbi:MAG: hypothetical protein R3C03_15035 [Pirellulaceae bacterium]